MMASMRLRTRPHADPRRRVVIALFAVTACIATSVSAFGVFLPVLSDAFQWSRGAVSVALSINLILGGVVAFPVASVADRHGPRGVLLLTVLIGAGGFALTATVRTLWHLYLVYGVMVGIGMSSIYVLSTATVSRWFAERRGTALAMVLSGFNLGWLLGGPLAALLIRHYGWRAAYVVLGGVIACIAGPASLWVRYPAGHVVRGSSGRGAAREPSTVRMSLHRATRDGRLWLLAASWFSMGLVFMTVTVHSVPFARDLGLPLEHASLALSAYGLGAAVGRLVSGVAADRFGAVATMHTCVLTQVLALAVLTSGPPTWTLIAVLVTFGVGAAGADNAFVKVVPDVFGLSALASIMSVLGLGWRSGAGLGPAAAGFLYDATRSYTIPFGCALLVLVLGAACFALGTRRLTGRAPFTPSSE
jgi:OFA family oxalate/formate antiporter-like MFS transporter